MHVFTMSIKRLLISGLLAAASSAVLAQQADSTAVAPAAVSKRNNNDLKISGIVKEAATGKALPAISVSVAGYSAALTDDKGRFSISVPDYHALLIVSSIGYQVKEVALKGKTDVTVALFEDAYSSVYDEAVMPFGNKSRNQSVYAAASVNTRGTWNRASETPDSYMQGMFAGLNVQRRSGTPGIGADLMLRGYNSLYARNSPLLVVDGMIYDTDTYSSSLISGHRTNHLANIELKDIDNITVLKDGSSIYGTRGSNGVILITTGRAKEEATHLDFAAYSGFNAKVENMPVMNAGLYKSYLSDLLATQPGITSSQIQTMPFMSESPGPYYYTYHQNTNWQNKVIDNGYNQNYYLKVTGGDNIATYALSMGYQSNDGLIANTGLNRYQTRFNANLNLSPKLKARVNLAFTRSEQDLRDQGSAFDTNPMYLSLIKAPFLTSHEVSENNILSPNTAGVDLFSKSNPYAAIDGIQQVNRNYRFMGSAGFDYSFSDAFSLNALVGLTFDKVRENTFIPEIGISPVALNTAIAYNRPGASVERLYSIYTDSWVSYKYAINSSNKITANAGFRFNNSKSESDYGLAYNTASDDFVTLGSGESSLRVVGGNLGQWNWLNTYLNVDYNSLNKYFLSFSIAADASSRFGKNIDNALTLAGNKYAVLPSVGAAWLLSSEQFMARSKAVETLKLRLSYGVSGNDDIGNYNAKTYYISQNFLGREGLVRGNIGNSGLQWETVSKANAGVDAAMFNERLNISLDAYQHKTSNMLIYQSVYAAGGFSTALSNSGAMKNRGLDLSMSGRIINKEKLKWDLGINLSRNRSEVTKLPDDNIITAYGSATMITRVGDAANLFYGYKTNGVYLSDEEAAASGISNKLANGTIVPLQGGDVRFADINNDHLIDENDRVVIGDPNPDFTGALSNSFSYKRWSLGALFTFSSGNDIYNGIRADLESMSGYENQTPAVLNRWRADGQVTNMPRAVWGDPAGNSRFSDRWIENGSFFRLRTVSVDYDLPFKAKFVKSATVYAIANNLFTVSKYLGYDPEFSASGSIFTRGVDIGLEPQFTSIQLGVRVGL